MSRVLILFSSWVSLALVPMAFAQNPIPKQLAGPPSEFSDIAPTNLAFDGIRSKSALLPVTFEFSKGTWQWRAPFTVEDPESFHMVVFSGEAQWNIQLKAPGMKREVPIEELYLEARDDFYGMGEEQLACKFFHLTSGKVGQWTLQIETQQELADEGKAPSGFVLISSESPYRLFAHRTTRQHLVGNPIGLAAFAYDSREFAADSLPLPGNHRILSAEVLLTTPSGERFERTMTDDGLNGDAAPWDGVFGMSVIAEEVGMYHAQILAKSISADGTIYTRTSEHAIPVVFPELELAPSEAKAELADDTRMRIEIPVSSYLDQGSKYRVFAEVWGHLPNGEPAPVAWIGGMSYLENQALSLGLDSRWIGMSGAGAPFELRNLRIEEPTYYIPLVTSDNLPVAVDRLPGAAFVETKTISMDMRTGPKPEMPAFKGSGSRLLLVHGYCSGNVWGGVAGQFSSASVFQDFGQNRSHDAFALQILNFGQTWNSYGIVAHSQGGAAATHLYTYYWSGLDNATGSRLIQSVGTPYQGTALAGNLAAIGAVFGAGCGTNDNLTYSGASSWLSGIPTWARNKVNYYTTSFNDRWWAYDYCHLATDLFLDDPDDGTTEKSKGQLSGGVNRGHATGWCHTSGMRDPAQTTDSGRNATMNANAAR